VQFEDESDLMALIKKPVHLVVSSQTNIRIRVNDDLELATAFLGQKSGL
jgi:2-C-methyl-D-erythritol 4-phosphate cytidylyltransferase